ncbi:UNVERIFIED_CONTAM: hypothetical protein FKN15_022793 [Acipenser sinensis]
MKKLFEAMTQQQSLLRKRLRGPPAISVPRVQAPSPEQEDAMSLTASEGMEPQELIFPSEDVKSDVWLPRVHDADKLGLAQFPPVEASIASLVDICDTSKECVVGPKCHSSTGSQSTDQAHNGDMDSSPGDTCAASSQQNKDKGVLENGVPKEPSRKAAELDEMAQVGDGKGEQGVSLKNGCFTHWKDQGSEKGEEEQVPPTPLKKRGRQKLEHPEKCKEKNIAIFVLNSKFLLNLYLTRS